MIFLVKTFPTIQAFMQSLLQMSFHVNGKSLTLLEWYITHRARIRSWMNSKMIIQMTFPFKRLPTNWAGVWLQMCFDVICQTLFKFERFTTDGTCVYSLNWMTFHVRGKMTTLTEGFATQRANVGVLTCVHSNVLTQYLFRFERFTAESAFMKSLLWMSFYVVM